MLDFRPSELAGDTPHTVRCNVEVLIIAASLRLTFFSFELAGDTPHTVWCNLEILIIAASLCLTFVNLNWRVTHLIQFGVTQGTNDSG